MMPATPLPRMRTLWWDDDGVEVGGGVEVEAGGFVFAAFSEAKAHVARRRKERRRFENGFMIAAKEGVRILRMRRRGSTFDEGRMGNLEVYIEHTRKPVHKEGASG